MRIFSFALAMIIFTLAIGAQPASATVPVFDYTNWIKNTLSESHAYTTAINSANQVRQQIDQLKRMSENLKDGSWLWGQVQEQIAKLNLILVQNPLFTKTEKQLNDDFNEHYQYHPPNDFDALSDKWNETTKQAAIAAAKTARLTVQDNANGAVQIQMTNRQSLASASGMKDTLQAVGKIADQQVEQLTKLSNLESVRTQMEVQYYSQQSAKDNEEHASNRAMRQWLSTSGSNVPHVKI